MKSVAVFLAVAAASTVPSAALADPAGTPTLGWDEQRPRVRPVEYAVTGATGAAALWMYFFLPAQPQPRWTGGILFDDAVRDALRVRSPSALRTVWSVSDAVGAAEVVLAVGVDSILAPALRGSSDVAWQLTWIDFESYSLGSIATFALYDSVGRARPSYEDCRRDPTLFDSCTVSPTASFPSGHVSESFISAGLSCANHAYVGIYGDRLLDALACVRDLALATSDGVLRVMGDRHYATDVLAGGALGFAFGYGLPVLLHYGSQGQWHRIGLSVAPTSHGLTLAAVTVNL